MPRGGGDRSGYYLVNGCVVYDDAFAFVHSFPGDFCRFLPSGELLTFISGRLVLFSRGQRILWTSPWLTSVNTLGAILVFPTRVHHHVDVQASGDFYFLAEDFHLYRGAHLRFDTVIKMSRAGELLFKWSTFENLAAIKAVLPFAHPADRPQGGRWGVRQRPAGAHWAYFGEHEYFHLNYVQPLPRTPLRHASPAFTPGNLLLSFPMYQTLVILEPGTNKILWAHTLDPDKSLFGQHCPYMLSSGNILMFVNTNHEKGSKRHSSVVELDPLSRQTVWRFVADPPESFHNSLAGCAQRLGNGDTLVTAFSEQQEAPPKPGVEPVPYIIVVDPQGKERSRHPIPQGPGLENRGFLQVMWGERAAVRQLLPFNEQ